MDKQSEELRAKYMKNPPEGMTAEDIREMSDEDLLDMDYSLNEDDEDILVLKGFISSDQDQPLHCARLPAGLFLSRFLRKEEFPIKQKKRTVFHSTLSDSYLMDGYFILT